MREGLFSLYYINLEKVYELCMILNNVIQEQRVLENKLETNQHNSIDASLTAGIKGFISSGINNFFKIKRNNDKLLSFGVDKIGEGKSTAEDIINLFGDAKTNKYPSEIKLMFITGDGFFKTFKNDIVECLQNSECNIKILLMSIYDNNDYIKRCEEICPQEVPYLKQTTETTLPILNAISKRFPNRIEIRYYKDEYRYNFRIAKYRIKDGTFDNMCWLNIQPFNKDAVDLSVGLTGSWSSTDKNIQENMFYQLDKGFDLIWDKYNPDI